MGGPGGKGCRAREPDRLHVHIPGSYPLPPSTRIYTHTCVLYGHGIPGFTLAGVDCDSEKNV